MRHLASPKPRTGTGKPHGDNRAGITARWLRQVAASGVVPLAADPGQPVPFVRAWPDLGECFYCWGPATDLDHVTPRARCGPDELDDTVPACFTCNTSKNQRTPDEWLAAGLYGAVGDSPG